MIVERDYFWKSLLAGCWLLVVGTIGLTSVASAADPAALPNVVFILSDDIGLGDVGPFKLASSPVPTPNIDRLAAEGMMFPDAHTSSAVCAPTRYSVITGNYPHRGRSPWGVWKYNQVSQILEGQRTVADVMRDAGYHSAFFGKWHLGADYYQKGTNTFYRGDDPAQVDFERPFENGPLDHGFDYSFVMPNGIQNTPYAYFEMDQYVPINPLEPDMIPVVAGSFNGGCILNDGYADPNWDSRQAGPVLAEKAVAFIDQRYQQNLADGSDTPFFVYYSTPSIHIPCTPPDTFGDTVVKGATGAGDKADMIFELDLEVGAIIEALEERNLDQNTVIIFTSDNGGTNSGIVDHDSLAGLRGRKAFLYEGGHRVPFIAKWGDGTAAGSMITPGSVSNQMIAVHDWVAAMYELTNTEIPVSQALDSAGILPVLVGLQSENEPVRNYMILQAAGWEDQAYWHAIRQGDWVLLLDREDTPAELYNLADDLAQTTNLIFDPQFAGLVDNLVAQYVYARYESDRTVPIVPDVCGQPSYDATVDRALFLWLDCDGSNQWHLRVSGGSTASGISFEGTIASAGGLLSLTPVLLEANDTLDSTTIPNVLRYGLNVWGSGIDGFDFTPGTDACFTPTAPDLPVYLGANRVPMVSPNLDLTSLQACSAASPSVCGEPAIAKSVDRATFMWKDCDGSNQWHLRVTGGDTPSGLVYEGTVASPGGLVSLTPVSIEASDVLDVHTNPDELAYQLKIWDSGIDGFDFMPGTDACFTPTAPDLPVYLGASRAPMVSPNLNLTSLQACSAASPSVCGEPAIAKSVDRATFMWKDCDGSNQWHLRVTGGDTPSGLVYEGTVASPGGLVSLTPVSIEASDVLDVHTNPDELAYQLKIWGSGLDGIDFVPAADGCYTPMGPALPVYVGAGRASLGTVNLDLDLDSASACN